MFPAVENGPFEDVSYSAGFVAGRRCRDLLGGIGEAYILLGVVPSGPCPYKHGIPKMGG